MDGHPGRSASSPSTFGSSTTRTPTSVRSTIAASTPGSGRPIEPGLMSIEA